MGTPKQLLDWQGKSLIRHAIDQILQSVPEDRQATLISRRDDDGYRFDIHLQGDQETVFFDA